MKTVLLYICDPDELYLNRLNGYIQHREYSPFIVQTYTDLDVMAQEDEAPGVLLVSSVYFEELQRLRESLHENRRTYIIFLDEGGPGALLKRAKLPKETFDIIEKYQSARKIYEYILDVCAARGDFLIHPQGAGKGPVKLVGVYTPENKRIQRACAWNMAQKLGSDSPGLYLSLEEFLPAGSISGQSGSLSDVIMAIKEAVKHRRMGDREEPALAESPAAYGEAGADKEQCLSVLDTCVKREGSLDIIPPAVCPYDLKEIKDEEWYYWLERMMRQSRYDFIVINFGNAVPGLCLLELCSQLYMPCGPEDEELCGRFKDTLKFMGKDAIAQKIQFVSMGGEEKDGLL